MTYAMSNVFCDYLSVTCHPDTPIADHAVSFLRSHGAVSAGFGREKAALYRFPDGGTADVAVSSAFVRVSASGAALAHLRMLGVLDAYLSVLGEHQPKVTRLDAACDTRQDGARVVAQLRKRYSKTGVCLTRKALPVTMFTSCRPSDGRETGTFAAGWRSKARITARVYDKAHERLQKADQVIEPTTRYELTFRTDSGVTLRDASLPAPVFWKYASPALLKAPPGVPDWVPDDGFGWTAPRSDLTPYQRLERQVQFNTELKALYAEADKLGPTGRRVLLRMIEVDAQAQGAD